jgi:hypothetical protein
MKVRNQGAFIIPQERTIPKATKLVGKMEQKAMDIRRKLANADKNREENCSAPDNSACKKNIRWRLRKLCYV